MNQIIKKLVLEFSLSHGATRHLIKEAESSLKISLPRDYVEFMMMSNGGEGFVGEQYLVLWNVEDIFELNSAYTIPELFPGFIVFGSNGSEDAFAFNMKTEDKLIVRLPFIGSEDDINVISSTFSGFLDELVSKK